MKTIFIKDNKVLYTRNLPKSFIYKLILNTIKIADKEYFVKDTSIGLFSTKIYIN